MRTPEPYKRFAQHLRRRYFNLAGGAVVPNAAFRSELASMLHIGGDGYFTVLAQMREHKLISITKDAIIVHDVNLLE